MTKGLTEITIRPFAYYGLFKLDTIKNNFYGNNQHHLR